MDFEVDRAWVGNPGSSIADFWVDAATYVGAPAGSFFGNLGQIGSPVTNGNVTMAFNNGGISLGPGISTGWEICIPRSELGNPTALDHLRAWCVCCSATSYFSDDSVTGSYFGDAGFNPDFGTAAYPVPEHITKQLGP
jgi:hypothetical protein